MNKSNDWFHLNTTTEPAIATSEQQRESHLESLASRADQQEIVITEVEMNENSN
jgi:hypothetical protein